MEFRILCFLCCLTGLSQQNLISDKEYAKLPPVFELDNFDRCLLFEDEALYCFVEYHVKPINPHNTSATWNNIQALLASPKNYRHDNLRHGICIPLTCPNISRSHQDPDFRKDLANCLNNKYEHLGIKGTIEHAFCQTKEPLKFDIYDNAAALFLITYLLFVTYASLYEGLARYREPEEYIRITSTQYGKIISCFSIFKNWERLKNIDWTPENVKFRGFQGVRFYNMYIVIILHTAMLFLCGPITNTKMAEGIFDEPISIILASGMYGLSTFFQMSSLFLTFTILKHYDEKSGKELTLKTILWILFYRYIRLTPALAFILLLHSTLLMHAGRGPWWNEFMGIDRMNCRENGWSNLLYINNWIDPGNMCLVETWYLAVDMQAFILVLVFLYFTVKSPRRFWLFLVIGWVLNNIYVMSYIYRNELYHYMRPYAENIYALRGLYDADGVWIKSITHTPMNLPSTLLGSAIGYWLYKNENTPILTSRTRVFLWHLASYGVGLGIIIIPGMWMFSENYYDSFWFSLPYLTFGPTIYCLAISLGIMGVTQGGGWMTKWILEWPPMYYFGRISYTTYLAHYPILFYIVSVRRSLYHVDYTNVTFASVEILSLSLIFGLVLSMVVEFPISAISSLFLKKKITNEAETKESKQKAS